MAKVPTYDGPQVSADSGQGPRLSVSTPGEAFGAGLGAALASIGEQVQSHADQMQRRIEQTQADEAFLEYTKRRNEMLFVSDDAFYRLGAKDAVDAYKPTVEKLTALRKEMSGTLSPGARALFNQATDADVAFSINNMASHSAKELRQWEKQTSESFLSALSDDMASVKDDTEYALLEQQGIDYLFANKEKLGIEDPFTFENYTKAWMSEARLKRVGIMALSDPIGALRYAEENKGDFTPDAYEKIITNLRTRTDPIIAQEAAEAYIASLDFGSAATAQTPDEWRASIKAAFPDATVTSEVRTPEHNRKVKGVPNSKHLTGEGIDLVPGPNETMAQLYERARKIPGVKAINEGDHVHIERVAASPRAAKKPIDVRANLPAVRAAIDADPNLTATQKRMAKTAANSLISDAVIELQARQANIFETVYSIAIGGPNAENPPTTLAQAMQDPEFAMGYPALDTQKQDFIQTQIKQNAARKNPPMTAEFLALQSQYDVLAVTMPDKFPSHDEILAQAKASAEAGNPWPNSVLNHILGTKTKLMRGESKELNASTQAAMGLKPIKMMLEDVGITRKGVVKDEEAYNRFWGRIDAHIKAYYATYKKEPDQAQLIATAGELITENDGFFGLFKSREFAANIDRTVIKQVPDEDIPAVVESLRRQGITRPSIQQIYQEWSLGQ